LIVNMISPNFIKEQKWLSEIYIEGLVSVIIPTYNRAKLLNDALESIYRQTYRKIEVIVVDDGSEDGSQEVVKKWQIKSHEENEFTVKYILQSNQGPSAARNRGLLYAKGQYIQFLDSDDLLFPEKISDAVTLFKKDSSLDMVYSFRGELKEGEMEIKRWMQQLANLELDPSPAEVVINHVSTPLPIIKRTVIQKAGPWDDRLHSLEDWEYIGRLSFWIQHARCVPKIQAVCRSHSGSRLSINQWGNANVIQANARAAAALYPFVFFCNSPRTTEAMTVLAHRSLSCFRVAAAAGHVSLARSILSENREVLSSRNLILVEITVWRMLLYLPDSFVSILFGPVRAIKRLQEKKRLLQYK
jgi:glycosyltransferase involved in cell wall biosynthesis